MFYVLSQIKEMNKIGSNIREGPEPLFSPLRKEQTRANIVQTFEYGPCFCFLQIARK